MIEGLQPYAEYKESGQPWLGRYPSHWVIKRGKSYMTCVDQRSKTGKEELLTVSSARGVVPRSTAKVTMFKAASYAGYKLCWPDDLVINSLWAWGRGLGVTQHHGIISTAYSVYRARPSSQINPRFLHELVRSSAFNWELQVRSKGIWISRLQLTDTAFLDAPIPLPPLDEQAAIVRFLEHANRKIDGFIRAKRKLIGLLNEQKQAIIHRAVTRGLNAAAAFKPSGIPWLGDIPKHWEVWRISRFAEVGNGSTPSRSNMAYWSNGIYPWLNSSHVNRGFIDSADQFVTTTALRECHLPRVPAGSVLVAITGQGKTRGTASVLGIEATINQHIAYITPRLPIVSAKFLNLSLAAAYVTLRAISDDSGSTKGALTCEDIKRFKVAVPPVPEQEALVQAIESETKAANTAIARTEREIALMQEYRTRLTADVVTGKLDVRPLSAVLLPTAMQAGAQAGAAAHLPALTPDSTPEPPDESESEESEV
jgi:type I restriction enzyme S subunit